MTAQSVGKNESRPLILVIWTFLYFSYPYTTLQYSPADKVALNWHIRQQAIFYGKTLVLM